jgi:hypothetical protein
MNQPWLTTSDWPVRAFDSNAAKNSAASATSSTVVNSQMTFAARHAWTSKEAATTPGQTKPCFLPGLGTSWVPARSLWQQQNTADNKGRDDKRGERTAEGKTAITDRLVQKVSDSGA